eukprot:15088479-Alexandrium_andersonii.AAC.1
MPPALPRPTLQEAQMLLHVDVREAAQHLAHLGGSGVAGGERVGGVAVELRLCGVLDLRWSPAKTSSPQAPDSILTASRKSSSASSIVRRRRSRCGRNE